MKKQKTVYVCGDCGADHAKWQGQCQSCGEWNTLSQLSVAAGSSSATQRGGYSGQLAPLQALGSVPTMDNERWRTESGELNRVLGGGLVPGSADFDGWGARRWEEYAAAAGGERSRRAKALPIHHGRGESGAGRAPRKRLNCRLTRYRWRPRPRSRRYLNIGMTISPTSSLSTRSRSCTANRLRHCQGASPKCGK